MLENYMDADSVSHMMHCEHLINDDDYEAITAAPNDSKMNTLLLHSLQYSILQLKNLDWLLFLFLFYFHTPLHALVFSKTEAGTL